MQPKRPWIYPSLGILVACLGVVEQLGSPGDKHLAVALCACLIGGWRDSGAASGTVGGAGGHAGR